MVEAFQPMTKNSAHNWWEKVIGPGEKKLAWADPISFHCAAANLIFRKLKATNKNRWHWQVHSEYLFQQQLCISNKKLVDVTLDKAQNLTNLFAKIAIFVKMALAGKS